MACAPVLSPNHPVLAYPDLVALAQRAGLNEAQAKTAAAISVAESGGRAGILNPCGADESYGLWQINMKGNLGPARMAQLGLYSKDQLYDPEVNARAMALISGGGTHWGDWSTFTSGAYKAYLGSGADIGSDPNATFNPDHPTDPGGNATEPRCFVGPFVMPGDIPNIPCLFYESWAWAWIGAGALAIGGVVVLAGVYMIAKGSPPRVPPPFGSGFGAFGSRSGSLSRGGLAQPLQTEDQVDENRFYAEEERNAPRPVVRGTDAGGRGTSHLKGRTEKAAAAAAEAAF